MIFAHDIYSITIGEFAELLESGNTRLICRGKVCPGPWRRGKAVKKLLKEFNKSLSGQQVERLREKDISKLAVLSKINILYPVLNELFRIYAITQDQDVYKVLKKVFREIYGRELKMPDDEDRVRKDWKRITERYGQVFAEPEETGKKQSFEEILTRVEILLAPLEIRNKKLYLFEKYVKLSVEKIRALQQNLN